MKKLMKLFVLVAAAAMALASCQKNEITGPETQEVHFTIKADIAETKTFITDKGDKTYTPSWSKEDKIGVLFALEENAKAVDFENTAEAGEEATFEGKHAFTVVEGASEVDGYLYAFYPSSAFNKVYSDGGVRLDLKVTQYPTSTSFDPSCDLLIAKPCYYMAEATGEDAEVVIDDMYFARMMSVLRINLNSEFLSNETVKSVSFDADGVDFTGAMKFNLATGEFVGNQSTSQDFSEVKAIYSAEDPIAVAGEKNSAYLVVAPVTIPSGTALTFTIETENYDIVKTITAPADMVMPAGNVAVINLSIAKENCTAKVEDTSDYSGEWLIVNSDLTRAANAWAKGNNLPEFVLTTNEGVVLESDGIANCKMIITKEADGYTIQDASGMYLYAAGASDKNYLYGQETKSYWTIEKNETNYVITSLAKDERNILRYNSSNKIFSCYSSGQADVTLYKYSEIIPDTTPSISVAENTNASIRAEGGELTFTCTTKNLEGETLEVVEESEYLTWSVAENVVTITVAANEAAESRTLNAVIKCGSVEVPVTINQAGKPAEGTPTSIVDVLDRDLTGATSTNYIDWSGKKVASNAVYAGNSAGGNSSIQLRSDKNTSGIVATTSGGKVRKIKVTWNSNTAANRTLDIYGKNTAYSAASELYSSTTQGTKLGSIKNGTSELEITGDYEYIGLRSNSGAMYLTSIEITWETNGGSGSGETTEPEEPSEPVQLSAPVVQCSASDITANSLKFTWSAISSASKYEVTFNNGTPTETPNTEYTATGLNANTKYTISVKAVGDGVNYTTSEAGTAEGTTKEEQQSGGGDQPTVAPSGTVLWSENWGTYTGTVANYTYTGTTVYGGSTANLVYSVDNTNDKIESTTANPISSNNLFFYKSAASSWTVQGIDLAGATSVTLKYTVNRTNVAVYYSVDGAAEKQLNSSSTSGVNTKMITNLSGSTLKLRFNKTGTSQNCRIDDISVIVN